MESLDHGIGDRPGVAKPRCVECECVQVEKPQRYRRVILEKAEVGGLARSARSPYGRTVRERSQHAPVAHHMLPKEFPVANGQITQCFIGKHPRPFGHGAQHEPIPRRDDLVVERGPHTLCALGVQHGPCPVHRLLQRVKTQAVLSRHHRGLGRNVQDVAPFEVAAAGYPPEAFEQRSITA